MFISCYWWLLNRWNRICWTGIVVYGFVEKFEVVLVLWENPMILIKWVELLFLMLDSCCLSVLKLFWPINTFWNLFWWIGVLKIKFWCEKGVKPERFWAAQMKLRLKRAFKGETQNFGCYFAWSELQARCTCALRNYLA